MPILRSLFILLAAATFAFGEDFTPENAATFALRHNKDLIAARHLIAEAEGRLRPSAALDSEGRRVPKASAAKRLIPTRTDSRNSRP